jgi:peptidoglycan/xylan/chitin deacetylase (PgdA/CDA1 family)
VVRLGIGRLTLGLVLLALATPAHAERTPTVNSKWHRCKGLHAPDAGPFGKRVALTFDDGPSLAVTAGIVAILRKHDVPATFFMVGRRLRGKKGRALAAEIAADPLFSVGNHTDTHPRLPTLSLGAARGELDRTAARLEKSTGSIGRFFRFPYSEATCATVELARERGYRIAGWHVDSADWCFASGKGRCRTSMWRDVPDGLRHDLVGLVLERIEANQGGIVLLHDTYAHTADRLETLIVALTDAGYTFVPLDDTSVFPLLNR